MKLKALKSFEFGGVFQNFVVRTFEEGKEYDLPEVQEVLTLVDRGFFKKVDITLFEKKVIEIEETTDIEHTEEQTAVFHKKRGRNK